MTLEITLPKHYILNNIALYAFKQITAQNHNYLLDANELKWLLILIDYHQIN